ncbi:hypothetical protein Lal_00027345 [Lupinus albus]|uniref:Putative encoded peptide n=1 Tax=Lupinus albus TaxID=3870 RepID=A0A6A4QFX1_LUPAL|nr:putative encoded peptide [Lupinus albus]KAF1873307.1 hypothetical protein Lal_00027345 [Lupinus albus]
MAQNKFFFSLILLALIIFCQGFQSIEGRYLKSDQDIQKFMESENQENVHGGISTTNAPILTNVSLPKLPSEANGATTVVPPPPGHGVDNFRPTEPGHSPGVGHSDHN